MATVEALARDKTDQYDNFNGYRRISAGEERIYDCYYKEQVGKDKNDRENGK